MDDIIPEKITVSSATLKVAANSVRIDEAILLCSALKFRRTSYPNRLERDFGGVELFLYDF